MKMTNSQIIEYFEKLSVRLEWRDKNWIAKTETQPFALTMDFHPDIPCHLVRYDFIDQEGQSVLGFDLNDNLSAGVSKFSLNFGKMKFGNKLLGKDITLKEIFAERKPLRTIWL